MWWYNGMELAEESIPAKAVGFIYLITQLSTGKRYIGRKLLTKAATKTINGKRKKVRKESDWKNYWSSSPRLKELIEEIGQDDFKREVLVFVTSKGNMAYCEELALYMVGALEAPDLWFNENIRAKIYRNWVKPTEAEELRNLIRYLHLEK